MRLFIGIALPVDVCRSIARISAAMQKYAPGRYVREDMYHITLAYIGECDEDMRRRATFAMRKCAVDMPRLGLALGKPGYFGKRDKAILHLGVNGGGELRPVSDRLRSLLDAECLPYDPKPLNPHITLARNVSVDPGLLATPVYPARFFADGLTLFNSTRVDGALRYIPLLFAPAGMK